ncbi:hypothetical protein [Sorangium cellulosum]|uniref:Secreted protein n=1 Tax=Sorangium cellulosum TaxID=56 RepID=A0A150PZ90_SORCE|nr:hypothetical protein [Sorangium cellulosum]KYF61002.1 hypothetical protein BE15_38620 [Sorangium cellulosum]
MRRYVLLAAAVAPLLAVTAAVSVPGCGEEFENICVFLDDSSSCYHKFRVDTSDQCWPSNESSPSGTFASRETLDVCFLDGGGQIVFDPPLDITAFPPTSVAFKRLDAQATECGSVTLSGEFSYSVTVQVPCTAEDVDAGAKECADADTDSTSKIGRTIALATPEGRDTLDVSCADGTSHHFNRADIQECADRGQDKLQPRAVLEASPGNQPPPEADPAAPETVETYGGFIKLSIHYPQSGATVEVKENDKIVKQVSEGPAVIEYFNCRIPPPAPICANGQKDGLETDVDCGGTLCGRRCDDGQSCAVNGDCAGMPCALDSSGFLKCQAPDSSNAGATTGGGAGADGSGGAGGQ